MGGRALGGTILSAYGTSLLGIGSGLLTNLWLIREITRVVTPAEFGTYAFVLQFTSYLGMLQLGLDFAAARSIAAKLGLGDAAGANADHWEVARFNARAAWGVAVLTLLLAAALRWWPGRDLASARLAAEVALLTGGTQVLAFLSRRFTAALIGSHEQAVANLVPVLSSLGTTLLAFGMLRAGAGVLCLPTAALFWAGASYGVFAVAVRSRCAWISRERPPHDRATLRGLVRFGGLATLSGVGWTVETTSDVVILGAYGGAAIVATYVLWWRFPSMLFDLCSRFVASAFPGFADRHGRSGRDAANLLNKVATVSIGLESLALVGVALWLPSFMGLWVGRAFALENSRAVAVEMGALVALRTLGNLLGTFWLASGRARYPAALGWVQAGVKVALAVALTPSRGIEGLLVASCLASVIQVVGYAVPLFREGAISRTTIALVAALNALALFVSAAAFPMVIEMTISRFAASTTATVIVWAAIWAVAAWNTDLRPSLRRVFTSPGGA